MPLIMMEKKSTCDILKDIIWWILEGGVKRERKKGKNHMESYIANGT